MNKLKNADGLAVRLNWNKMSSSHLTHQPDQVTTRTVTNQASGNNATADQVTHIQIDRPTQPKQHKKQTNDDKCNKTDCLQSPLKREKEKSW